MILPYPGVWIPKTHLQTFQLALGQNPKLPSAFLDNPPALTPFNLAVLHKARETFAACGSSEKIWCALNNNIRTSRDTKHISGDSVYFKRANDKQWKGPRKVLGQDRQQALVKYGSYYVRVHSCRLSLTWSTNIKNNNTNNNIETDEIKEVKHKVDPTT